MSETQGPEGACGTSPGAAASTVVIFGASGDLTRRKLMPALYRLFLSGAVAEPFVVLGAARTAMSDDVFRESMKGAVAAVNLPMERWREFAARLHYQTLAYDDPAAYGALAGRISDLEEGAPGERCRVFNLSLPPQLYGTVATRLGEAGLAKEEPGTGALSRLVVEKPFGWDLASSRELNGALRRWFRESQIFRIDHYMTKETVRNILVFRFANAIFEPLWNRNYIEYVRINASETLGIEERAGYYEQAGVLLDMMQNHMMQLLSLVAAEPPSHFDADRVRDKQEELFHCLRPFPMQDIGGHLVLGQYAAGRVEGRDVPGYREEEGVDPQSPVPTYALIRVLVDNWRWKGVPFYLTSGKRLRRKVTRIDIQFKGVPHSMLPDSIGQDLNANRLVLGIQPEEVIFLNFQAKKPGATLCLRTVGLQFTYHQEGGGTSLDAYAKALLDTLAGDQTLFWREDCLDLSWSYFDPLLKGLEACRYRLCDLHHYRAGSLGPKAAIDLLPPGSWPEKP